MTFLLLAIIRAARLWKKLLALALRTRSGAYCNAT
jgi:hypothetical protein